MSSTAEHEINTTSTGLQLTAVEGLGVPRGAAYASPATLDALSCASGDVVLIQAVRTTVARLYPWPSEDERQGGADLDPRFTGDHMLAMEGLVRQNAGAALGDLV